MPDLSRRNLLKVTAGAAVVAVPMAAIGTRLGGSAADDRTAESTVGQLGVAHTGIPDGEPVMFYVHDASRGDVSILHGTTEVIVRDRQLVAKILRAAGAPSA